MYPSIYLVCGYRRTGKDTFYSIFSTHQHEPNNSFKRKIYKSATLNYDLHINTDTVYERTAFADHLKIEASKIYNIPSHIPDGKKDNKIFTHYKTGELVSARDIYIEYAAIRKKVDINYWCKLALSPYLEPRDRKTICIVTDFRFINEYEYVRKRFENVVTIRLYRSDVEEPPMDVLSEHSLDNFQTDFLLVPDNVEEFEIAIRRFPQYENYILSGYIQ